MSPPKVCRLLLLLPPSVLVNKEAVNISRRRAGESVRHVRHVATSEFPFRRRRIVRRTKNLAGPSQHLVQLVKPLAPNKEAEHKEQESQSLCCAETWYACLEGYETSNVGLASKTIAQVAYIRAALRELDSSPMSTNIYIYSQNQQTSLSSPSPVTGTFPRDGGGAAATCSGLLAGFYIHLQLPD
jgi:hypothetical protein